jgi:putative hemolysin
MAAAVLATVSALAAMASAEPEPLVLGPFLGTIPCADCPGIETELTLTRREMGAAEGTYALRSTYLERGPPIEQTGSWTTLRGTPEYADATVYELNPDEPGREQYFLKVGDDRVTMLDRERNPIQSTLNFTLTRQEVRLANPASVNCAAKGGVSKIVQDASGWRGLCRFPDGRECDEWAFLRDGVCGR